VTAPVRHGLPDPAFDAWVARARSVRIEDVAAEFRLRLRGRIERVGPCPECGGTDRFALNTRKQIFNCRACGGGDVIRLVQKVTGCDFLAACERLAGAAPPRGQGHMPSPAALAALEEARARKRAEAEAKAAQWRERERTRLWGTWSKADAAAGSPVEAYLGVRGVPLPPGAHLRFAPDHILWGEPADNGCGRARPVLHRGPAMLAAIADPDGRFCGLHATWISLADPDGKARVLDPETGELAPAKKTRGSLNGGRIELVRHRAPRRLVLGEGIETVLSVWAALAAAGEDCSDTAFWTSISLANMGGKALASAPHPTKTVTGRDGVERPWKVPGPDPDPAAAAIPIPETVGELFLLGDGDSDRFLTETALVRAARRFARPGLTIRAAFAPDGMDFNTLWRLS